MASDNSNSLPESPKLRAEFSPRQMMSKFEQLDFTSRILVTKIEEQQTEEKQLVKRIMNSISGQRSLYTDLCHHTDNKRTVLSHDYEKNEREILDLLVVKEGYCSMIRDLNEEYIKLQQQLALTTQKKTVADSIAFFGTMRTSSLQNYSQEAYKISIKHNDVLRKANIELTASIEALRNQLGDHKFKLERLQDNINMN